MFCSECRAQNNLVARYCVGCGSELKHFLIDNEPAIAQPSMPASSLTQSDTCYKSLSRKEQYHAVIGSNQQHYLKKFLEFDGEGKGTLSWHWPAFLLTTYWLLYRKMWRNALLYGVLPYGLLMMLIGILHGFYSIDPFTTGLLFLGTMLGLGIVPALYADALYYKHCQQVITHARQHTSHPHRLYGVLSTQGGTSKRLILIFIGLLLVTGTMVAVVTWIYTSTQQIR